MKVPKSYEGRLVCAHLGAPVYMFEYGGSARLGGSEHLVASPLIKAVKTPDGDKQSQAMSNLLVGALVKEVTDDSVLFELFDPQGPTGMSGTIMHKLVPSALILSLDLVAAANVSMPVFTQSAPANESSRIIQP